MNTRLREILSSHAGEFEEISDRIWDFAEFRFQEHKSAELQAKFLEDRGFAVTRGIGNIPTAFKAEWGDGSPVIGFLGEYDALPGLSQKADAAHEEPLNAGGCGHGCGHHLLGTGCMEAACALAEFMTGTDALMPRAAHDAPACERLKESGLQGKIVYFGCPGEESGAGKAFMAREGCFDGIDFALAWHPNDKNGMMNLTLANARVIFTFSGVAAHAAACPEKGRSALDSCEIMNVGVNYLREHVPDAVRMHYAYLDAGGAAPNVVQSHAALLYAIRAPEIDEVESVLNRVLDIAKGAALICGTTVVPRVVSAYANTLSCKSFGELAYDCLSEAAGEVSYTDAERSYAAEFVKTGSSPDAKESIITRVETPDEAKMGASTDVGDVSWLVPTQNIYVTAFAAGTGLHTWPAVAQGRGTIAKKGMHTAALALASMAIKLLQSSELREKIKRDFDAVKNGRKYRTLIPDDVKPGMF